jgi:hypothetical protein
MNKLFLILLPIDIDRQSVINHLVDIGIVDGNLDGSWFYNMPSSLFVRCKLTAKQLQNEITKKFPTQRILVIHISRNVDFSGIVPNEHVRLYNNL